MNNSDRAWDLQIELGMDNKDWYKRAEERKKSAKGIGGIAGNLVDIWKERVCPSIPSAESGEEPLVKDGEMKEIIADLAWEIRHAWFMSPFPMERLRGAGNQIKVLSSAIRTLEMESLFAKLVEYFHLRVNNFTDLKNTAIDRLGHKYCVNAEEVPVLSSLLDDLKALEALVSAEGARFKVDAAISNRNYIFHVGGNSSGQIALWNSDTLASLFIEKHALAIDEECDIPTKDSQVELRPMEASDARKVWECYSGVPKEFLLTIPKNLNEVSFELERRLGDESVDDFVVEVNGEFAGCCNLSNLNNRHHEHCCEIAGMGHPDFRGRGFAARGLRLLIELAWEKHPKLVRIEGTCRVHNIPSAKTMEKAGMKLEGRMRKRKFVDGVFYDDLVYAITR